MDQAVLQFQGLHVHHRHLHSGDETLQRQLLSGERRLRFIEMDKKMDIRMSG